MSHVMVDLETLGTSPGCIILSIGAAEFSGAGLGREFYHVISTLSCKSAGLIEEPETVAWWAKQSADARQVLDAAKMAQAHQLANALQDFTGFLENLDGDFRIWGNGADFDIPILAAAYRAVSMPLPWKFWNARCYRTFKAMAPWVPPFKRSGIHHNALDDAKTQALHAVEIMRSVTEIMKTDQGKAQQ